MSTPEDTAAEERRAKAAARQAKLLAKSQARLDKITGAAKGEGRIISDSSVGIAPQPTPKPINKNPSPPSNLADLNNDDDPAEIDLATAPVSNNKGLQEQLAMFGGMGGMPGMEGGQGGDMFSQMLAQMTQQAGGGGEAGQNLFAAMGAMGGSGAGGGNPFAPQQQTPQPIEPKTFLDKVFPLIHLVSMVALAVYAVVWMEPSRRFGLYGSNEVKGIDWNAWGSLASRRPRDVGAVGQAIGVSQLGQVPLLWMFVTVELILQTTRLFLLRNRPTPPTLLNSILPLLSQFSPQLGLILETGSKYLTLFSTCLNDLAVVVFVIGIVIMIGHYKTGGTSSSWVETVQVKGNEMLSKATGDL